MRAIVFDFFGTLTDPAAEAERRRTFADTAAALGVPPDRFWTAMSDSFGERITGVHGDTAATLSEIARRCGHPPSPERLARALVVHRAGAAQVRRPRDGVLALLDQLRARGFALGLISDCSSELCESWADTPYAARFDATVFSWQEGCRKPDQRLYAAAAARLGIPAACCWYVGDGGGREHQGAVAAGMRPVLVTNARYPGAAGHRADPDPILPDAVIDELDDVAALVGWPR